MSMINCPECGEKISDKAESCPHCGCPQSEFKGAFLKPDKHSMNYCPKCGAIMHGVFNCSYCGHDLINAEITSHEHYVKRETGELDDWEKSILDKARQSPEFSEEEYQKRITTGEEPYLDKLRSVYTEEDFKPYVPENAPKCPTCNSTNIEKIGTGERVVSAALFGLFSRKISKTYRCNSCGYMW